MNTIILAKAALVLLREGAEALLIIAALAAYLNRLGASDKTRVLYTGAGLAVLASILVAVLTWLFLDGEHSDMVEGITMLLAAGVLIYVSGWLFARRDVAAWQGYLKDKVDAAVSAGGLFALGTAAFLAVFREGAETVLFLQALAADGGGWSLSLVTGVALGTAGLAVAFFAVRGLALRLPLKPFFVGTAALLYAMAVLFVGPALMELQELAWLPYTGVATPEWLGEIGVAASAEGLVLQGLLIAAVPLALKLLPALRPRRDAPAAG